MKTWLLLTLPIWESTCLRYQCCASVAAPAAMATTYSPNYIYTPAKIHTHHCQTVRESEHKNKSVYGCWLLFKLFPSVSHWCKTQLWASLHFQVEPYLLEIFKMKINVWQEANAKTAAVFSSMHPKILCYTTLLTQLFLSRLRTGTRSALACCSPWWGLPLSLRYTNKGSFESLFDLSCMSLGSWRKQEHLEEIHANTGRKASNPKSFTVRSQH